jgi:LysM repeat protein
MSGAHHAASDKTGTKRSVLAVTLLIVGVALAIAIWGLQRQGSSSTSGAGSPGQPITAPTSASVDASQSTPPASSSAPSPTPAVPTATVATTAPAGPITYVVQPGDTLTKIAAWFKLHGYGQLYEQNKAVIGDNPRLIHPGQRITVAPTGMTTSG